MMRFVFLSVLSLLIVCRSAVAEVHDVLAHASADRSWIGKVTAQPAESGGGEQTDLLIRQSGPGEKWKTLATVPARVTALACRSSQLVVLQGNGDWKLIWSAEGGSSGEPLPGRGRIRVIGDDGENLWAIGAVNGGIGATTEPATTAPTTEPSKQTVAPLKLVLFEQQAGRWNAITELPAELQTEAAVNGDLSLAIIGERPIVAFALSDGDIHTIRLTTQKTWENLGEIPKISGEKGVNFQLVDGGGNPILWTSTAKQAGRIYPGADGKSGPIDLKWVGDNPPDSAPAITTAGGYLRLVWLHKGNIFEQRYEYDGTPVANATELRLPESLNNSPLHQWLNVALLVALAFSVMATLYRRTLMRSRATELVPPAPAPIFPRGAAGFIDILPVLATVVWVTAHQDSSRDPLTRLEDVPALIATGISIAIYLLHTTISEVITAKSIGKWLFGLKVVSIDGTKPGSAQLFIRNILRVLDLFCPPLLILAIISPLRQRSADIAAGTMVVKTGDETKPQAEPPTGSGDTKA